MPDFHFISYFRHCSICQNSLCKTQWICLKCHACLMAEILPNKGVLYPGLKFQTLIEWKADSIFIDKAVKSLKGGYFPSAVTELVSFFHKPQYSEAIVYPSKGQSDHASLMAETLSAIWQIPCYPLLKESDVKQATNNLQLRRKIQFGKFPLKVNHPVIVDDIVTSGATARACWQALGSPQSSEILAFFRRPKERGHQS